MSSITLNKSSSVFFCIGKNSLFKVGKKSTIKTIQNDIVSPIPLTILLTNSIADTGIIDNQTVSPTV